MNTNYYNLSVAEAAKKLSTDVSRGLTGAEVMRRQKEVGYNEFVKAKRTTLAEKFFSQFRSFMIIVLIVAAAISGTIGYLHGEGFTDAIIILAIVIINAIVGTAQEARAENALEALEKLSSPHCKVVRDGQVRTIESRDLVPGDVVVLETGDAVPADMRLSESINLKIEEAALTGESVPVEKNTDPIKKEKTLGDRLNMAFGSTSVSYGRGRGVVVATGMSTEVGHIASMIQGVPNTKTPLQVKLDKLGRVLAVAALTICVVIFGVGVLYGKDLLDMFMTAVSLAVAAIPEGLPAVATVVLAVGVFVIMRRGFPFFMKVQRRVDALQVICSDKTGTLTRNKMTVVKVYADGATADVEGMSTDAFRPFAPLVKYSILANDARVSVVGEKREVTGDPTEIAMLDLGLKYGLAKEALEKELPRVAEVPFDSERKMMTTIHHFEGGTLFMGGIDRIKADGAFLVAVKGGTDELLARCEHILERGKVRALTPADREKINAVNLSMAENALRVLAVAMDEVGAVPAKVSSETVERDLVFVGLLGMIDPPREEVKVAVATCRAAGIKPVMITGDHKITAVAIATQLGIISEGEEAITGAELEKMSDEELLEACERISVYARVAPEHKVRIVKAFQSQGKIVAMTGDGVNDAPALKLADIGVAMGITGTDVSKEASDVVLADDNFATIVTAVEEGRSIYDNILKVIRFLLSTNIGEIIVLLVAVLLNWDTPLLPIHILWINLVTDSLPALALSVDPPAAGIMKRPPIDSRKGIMTGGFALRVGLQGIMIGALSLVANRIGIVQSADVAHTMTFAVLAFSQITLLLASRSTTMSAFRGLFSNRWLWAALMTVVAMMMVVLEVPALERVFRVVDLSWEQWWWVMGLSLAPLVITEVAKGLGRMMKTKN